MRVFPDRPALYDFAATCIADALREALAARGLGCAALSGGSTPAPAYDLLARRDLDWTRVSFALVDERRVPLANPASNEALLRRTLAPALARGARILPLRAENESAYAELDIDIALLGMGSDGHTASWFPGAERLGEALDPASTRDVIAIHAPRAAGCADRLTLTFAAIARARRIVLLIAGTDKRAVFEAAANAGAPVAALFALGDKFEACWAP